MSGPTLLMVGHGSRDPRSAAELTKLAGRVQALRPDLDARLSFLELSLPSFEQVLGDLHGEAVVVPLLLGRAFHARIDIPAQLDAGLTTNGDLRAALSDALGPHELLDQLAAARAAELPGADAFVLLGTGSSNAEANARVASSAAGVSASIGSPVEPAFVTADPSLEAAVDRLRARGGRCVGVLPWFLAPGLLLDRGIAHAARLGITDVATTLADDPLTAELVVRRYTEAIDSGLWLTAPGLRAAAAR